MDATGLWFSKLERNFSSDYGQFQWTEEQRIWDWDKLTTAELVKTKESFDLPQADEDLNSHVNIFNLYGAFSS